MSIAPNESDAEFPGSMWNLVHTKSQYQAEYGDSERNDFDGLDQGTDAEFERRARMEQEGFAMEARKEAEES